MAPIYHHDPEAIQEQLAGALRAADAWKRTTGGLWLALQGLRSAQENCPSDEGAEVLKCFGQQLQEQYQQARHTAEACQEAVQDLSRQLARIADKHLALDPCDSDLEEAA
jgi:hypothetical protein